MRRIVMATAAVLALAACNKDSGKPAAGAPAAQPDPLAGIAAPTRKPGLWQISMMRDGKPAGGMMGAGLKTCLDAKSASSAAVFGRQLMRGRCTDMHSTRNADGSYDFSASCPSGAGVRTIKVKLSGDFNSKYTMHAETETTGSDNPERNGHHVAETSATWLSACPVGMADGDIMMPDGTFVSPRQLFGRFRGQGGGGSGGEGGGQE